MKLKTRETAYIIPRYSLTGDVLSFQRCGRQYRYYNGSSLPPSRPVQFWTGEFVHSCLEDAYSIWNMHQGDPKFSFPWPSTITPYPRPAEGAIPLRAENDIGLIGDRAEERLSSMQKNPRSKVAREAAYERVDAAINILGPCLFPLITNVEQKISGSRDLPKRVDRTDKYELFGIADVISHIELEQHPNNNVVSLLLETIPTLKGNFDIIVDYKAARRPSTDQLLNNHHKWQIQTYSWLRNQVEGNVPIKAGIVVYVNELSPTKTDLLQLKRELQSGTSDVLPQRGSADYYALYRWTENDPIPRFTTEFLLRRALRFISTSEEEAYEAVKTIDAVVQQIEEYVQQEFYSGSILDTWVPGENAEQQDCDACDFRRFCVKPGAQLWKVQAPG